MAALDESDVHLEFCKIPVIDLHYFCQDEINSASKCSNEFRFDDVVIPKIDPSIFHESSGSRKQTYSKLRLSTRKEEPLSLTRRRAGLLSVSRHLGIRRSISNGNKQKEARRIVELIQEFLEKGDHISKSPARLNMLKTKFTPDDLPIDKRSLTREVGLQLVLRDPALKNDDDAKLASSTLDIDGSMSTMNVGLDRAKKKIRKKEGARRKALMNANEAADGQMFLKVAGNDEEENRGLCFTSSDNKVTGNGEENSTHSDQQLAMENNGASANNVINSSIWPFVPKEPFVPQLKRKFAPLATEAELRDFFKKVGGQWASKMKKRKIVDAEDFGEGFPKGWKLLLGVRKKYGRFLIECRKYISPDGLQFASCREVSAYFHSTLGHSPAGVVSAWKHPGYSTEGKDGHQILMASMPDNSMVQNEHSMEGKLLEQQAEGNTILTTSSSKMGKDAKQDSLGFNGSTLHWIEKQQTWQRNVSVETLDGASNSRKRYRLSSQNTPMYCKKCNVKFSNRSTFMAHLTIHHVKKKKVIAAKTIAHGVIMQNGKYECQICHKVFDEKIRYTGHVGVHARKNVRKLRDSSMQSSVANKADLDNNDICDDKLEEDIKVRDAQQILENNVYDEETSHTNAFLTLLGESSLHLEQNVLPSSNIGGFLSALDPESAKVKVTAENQKFDSMTDFEKIELYMPSPKFSFGSSQEANCMIGTPIELGLDADDLPQVAVPSEQFGWEPFLSERGNSSQFIVCIWCNTEFSNDGLDPDLHADSVGFICPVCKTKISGQVDVDEEFDKM